MIFITEDAQLVLQVTFLIFKQAYAFLPQQDALLLSSFQEQPVDALLFLHIILIQRSINVIFVLVIVSSVRLVLMTQLILKRIVLFALQEVHWLMVEAVRLFNIARP